MMRRCEHCATWQEKSDGWGVCQCPQTRIFVQIPNVKNGDGTLLTAPDFGCVEFTERTGASNAA